MDFSFNNSLIKGYFDGNDDYVPTSELIYVHEHPLINGSFLVQLEGLINKTSEFLVMKNVTGTVIEKFIQHTITLGAELPNINAKNASSILKELRKIYILCNSLLNQSGI